MGGAGAVACVSGRTGGLPPSVVLPVLRHLENEFFLGSRCVSGDDGRLTWLVLASGYRTVHQSLGPGTVDVPRHLQGVRQAAVRWSRNSYRCYLTAVWKGWLWRVPFVTKVTVLQILLTPVTMGLTSAYLVLSRLECSPARRRPGLGGCCSVAGFAAISHLRRHPQEILLLPLVALVVIFVALPIKVYAFVTMNKQGWLTRHADTVGGDGQSAASLQPQEKSVQETSVQETSAQEESGRVEAA